MLWNKIMVKDISFQTFTLYVISPQVVTSFSSVLTIVEAIEISIQKTIQNSLKIYWFHTANKGLMKPICHCQGIWTSQLLLELKLAIKAIFCIQSKR